jgi:uncharacterized membrane protein YhaH (DUF805 family)
MVRFCLASAVGGAMIVYFAMSHPSGWTLANVGVVASLFGALAVVGLLVFFFGVGLKRAKASGKEKGVGWIVFAFVMGVAAIVTLAVAADWFIVDSIRPTSGPWSILPRGNLFVAGGRDGWVYVGLVALLLIAVFGQKIAVYLGFQLPSYKTQAVAQVPGQFSTNQ